jgi:hypothetical protein
MEMFHIEPEMATFLDDLSDEDLRDFAELQDDPASDHQIELHIYICFLISTRTPSTEHLEQAIQQMEGWIAVIAIDHQDRARRFQILDMMLARMSQYTLALSNSGVIPGMQHERTREIDELNHAVEAAKEAIKSIPLNHPNRPALLSNLGIQLGRRFERTGLMDDLNRAVEVADMAVDTIPQDHFDRAGRLNNFRNLLGIRFKRTGLIDDLNCAVDVTNMAVNAILQDYPR